MSNYPSKIKGMPADVYGRVLWTIRGYKRMKEAADDIIHARKQQGERVQTAPGNPTQRIAEEREPLLKDIRAVEKALETIPEEYRQMVFENIATKKAAYNIVGAHENTIYTYRRRVFIETARNLKLINNQTYETLRSKK